MNAEKPSQKKFVKDLVKYFPSAVLPALIGFLTLPILTKIFEPSVYGSYILVISLVGVLSMLVETLWGNPITRFFVSYKNQNHLECFYDTIMVGSIISISLIVILLIILIDICSIDAQLYDLMIMGVLYFVLSAFFGIFKRLLIVKEKSGTYSIFVGVYSITGFSIGIILILVYKVGIIGIILGNILSYLLIILIIYYITFRRLYIGRKFSKSTMNKFLVYGAPLVVSNLAAWILSLSDRYILEFFKGSIDVGIYSASYGISEQTITILWTLFMTASYPLIVRMWENHGEIATQNYITKLTRYFLLASVPSVVGLSVLAKPLMVLLTSPAYYEGYIIIPVVVSGALFLGLQWWTQLGLALKNKTTKIAMVILSAGILNVVLNIIFIPYYGYVSAAVVTFVSYLISFVLSIKISNRYLKWNFPLKSFSKIVFASLIMGLILYPLQNFLVCSLINLIIEIFSGILIYGILILFLGEFKNEEMKMIKQLFYFFKTGGIK